MLTKRIAISEHQRQTDTIKYLQQQNHTFISDMEMQRRELAALRMENSQLRGELTAVSTNHTSHNSAPAAGAFQNREQRPELPPLRSLSGDIPQAPESMTGVQYEQPRMTGYRASEARPY